MGLLSDVVGLAKDTLFDLQKASIVGNDSYTTQGRAGVPLVADPYVWAVAGSVYREKPAIASYSVLRYLCRRDTILASIILTRLRQVKAFARVRTHDEAEKTNATGFRVRLRSGAGERSKVVERREDELNQFILNCGRPDFSDRREKSFAKFIWKFTKDRLMMDQATAYIRFDRGNSPSEFYALDGATIRIVDPAKRTVDGASYVQMYQGRVITKFEDREIMFCPENLSTEIIMNGYSTSETEIALKKVMAHLGIDETNYRQFHPGSMPKGLLTVSNADISEEQIQVLESRYKTQVANYRGKHRIPLIAIPRGGRLEFVHFPQATDIEHGKFLDFLVNSMTALFGMDPAEINFPNRSGSIAGATPAMIQSSPESTRLTASRDKGLRTLLAFLEDCMNDELMPYLDPQGDFEFSFIGFDRQTESDRLAQDDTSSRVYRTINEIRESHGLAPLPDGDIIRDATWLQAKSSLASSAPDSAGQQSGKEEEQKQWKDMKSVTKESETKGEPKEPSGVLW